MNALVILAAGIGIGASATLIVMYPKYYDAHARAADLQRTIEQAREKEDQAMRDRKAADVEKARELAAAHKEMQARQALEAARERERRETESKGGRR
jgi:hypothetical protein